MSSLKNKNILLCVTGSIAAYKACELLRILRKEGANVQVMMSYSAEKFIGKATFSALSNNKVLTNLFSEESSQSIEHVYLSFKLDLVVVVPATANIICKAAQGVADEIVSTTLSICDIPILFAPAMNFRMWNNEGTINAVETLKKRKHIIIEPDEGELASLHKGKGRLSDISMIMNSVRKLFDQNLILENKKILITAGPTQEPLDPVRFITNRSSGKMGYAIAKAAKEKKVVTQLGTQIHSHDNYRRVVEMVQSGVIGVVNEAHAWVGKAWGGHQELGPGDPAPTHFHHDLWLGPASKRPYHDFYHPAQWRRF